MNSQISRRQFLRGSIVVASGIALAACSAPATPTPEPKPPTQPPATTAPVKEAQMAATAVPQPTKPPAPKYKEAPQLAKLVAEGKLPPVEKRLPPEPIVVDVEESIGKYGGTMYIGTPDLPQGYFYRYWDYQPLWRWAPRWNGTMPGMAKSVDVSPDSTVFTFHLRKGCKWSDGTEFTVKDYMFWYDDVILNKELTPSQPSWLKRGGKLAKFEALDDYTLRVTFAEPNGIFLMNLAEGGNSEAMTMPAHYMKQFHIKYNPKAADEAKAAGFASWMEYFDYHLEQANDSNKPNLGHFHMEWDLKKNNTQLAASRNPYYFKVDPEGNQLPYIDRCVSFMIQDIEVLTLKTMNGEIDHVCDKYNLSATKPAYIDNQKKGKYRFFNVAPTYCNAFNIAFNLNCTDPVLKEIFNNKDFRIGLSHAINREEVISVVFPGDTRPHQSAPRPESRFYHKRLATQYTEYNVKLANEYLDKTGWTKRDSEGYRLGPNGKRISFVMELDEGRTAFVDTMQLVIRYWKAVGVECILKTMVRKLWEERVRRTGLDFHAAGHSFGGGIGEYVLLDPRWYFPFSTGNSFFAKAWAHWYNQTGNAITEEPPAPVKKQMELYRQAVSTADAKKQLDLMMQVLDIAADNFFTIGICYEPMGYGIATNRMRNVPDNIPLSWVYPSPGPDNMDQMWIAEQ